MSDSKQPRDAHDDASLWDDPRITAYVMGELDAEERLAFEKAMADSAGLRGAVDQAGRVTDQLQQLFDGETSKTLDGDRRAKILAASVQSPSVDRPPTMDAAPLRTFPPLRSRMVPWILAAAASLLLLLGLLPPLQQARVAFREDATTAKPTSDPGDSDDPMVVESGTVEVLDKSLPVEMVEEQLSRSRLAVDFEGEESDAEPVMVDVLTDEIGANVALATTDPSDAAGASGPSIAETPSNPETRNTPIMSERLAVQTPPAPQPDDTPHPFGEQATPTPLKAGYQMSAPAQPVEVRLTESESKSESNLALAEISDPTPSRRAAITSTSPAPASPAPGSPAPAFDSAPGASSTVLAPVQTDSPVTNDALMIENRRALPLQSRLSVTEYESTLKSEVDESVALGIRAERLDQRRRIAVYQDGDRFDPIVENEFKPVREHPLSTFSIDVDTASYSKVRRTLSEGRMPRPDAVRIEELVNYFDYDYPAPEADSEHPFATKVTIATCPWNQKHRLARVAIQGKTLERDSRPPCNLVFLLDTSGSMNQPNKLPLVVEGMKMLTGQLGKEDRVAIVVYAGSAGMVLDSTPAGKQKKIKKALSQLSAGGSTNGGAGIQLAYATARDHFIEGGVNRVILCTDGDFNVGLSGTDELVRLIKDEASDGIFLTALGFGMGNHNDAMMEQISGKGNGNYAFIDTANEACKVLVRQSDATLVTIAKDVKIQIEFNGRMVSKYRLIGYENRVLAKEDFNDDKKDAGEIGAGHQVTALYELVMADGQDEAAPAVDPLKYQKTSELTEAASADEVMTVKLRYKQPDGDQSTLIQVTAKDDELTFGQSDSDFQFAASVASFAMLLRQSQFAGDWTLDAVREVAGANLGEDEFQLRSEFVNLVGRAMQLSGR